MSQSLLVPAVVVALALVVWVGIVAVVGKVWQKHGDLAVVELQKLAEPAFQ